MDVDTPVPVKGEEAAMAPPPVVNGNVNGLSSSGDQKHHRSSSGHHHKSSSNHHKHKHHKKDHHEGGDHQNKTTSSSTKDKDKERHHHHSSGSSSHKSSHHHRHKSTSSSATAANVAKDKDQPDGATTNNHHNMSNISNSAIDSTTTTTNNNNNNNNNNNKVDRHHTDKSKSSSSSKHSSSSTHKDKDSKHSSSRHNHDNKNRHHHHHHHHSIEKERKHKSSHDKKDKDVSKNDEIKSEIKQDPDDSIRIDYGQIPSVKEEVDAQDVKNVSAASSCDYNLSQFKDDESRFEAEDSVDKVEDKDNDDEEEAEDEEATDEEDIPLSARISTSTGKRKRIMSDDEDNEDESKNNVVKSEDDDEEEDDDEDDAPLIKRRKSKKVKSKKVHSKKKEKHHKKKRSKRDDHSDDEDEHLESEEDVKPKQRSSDVKKPKTSNTTVESPKKGRKKKEEEEVEVWKWWEETKKDDGQKWTFLEHKGPVFAPAYEPLPDHVKFFYNGKQLKLSMGAEEVATFYAKMLDHDYTTKDIFNKNFFKDWRKTMTSEERHKITELTKCDFKAMHTYFLEVSERNRNRTKEEKADLKKKNEDIMKEYGYCTIDGHREKIGNFKIEPPGLFRGRGEHPKMGMLKRRVVAEDVIINCSKDAKRPVPPAGHKWREVRHDNTVTWLANWTENVQSQGKYVMLNPSSKLKGEKDWQKYETARRLHKCIDKIRREYRDDWKSKEMRIRQRAVALYFIDKLALRAGNEKDEDQADTVGCCSLRYEHIELHEKKDGKEHVVVFDFPGKDSIRYYNEVQVEKRVFKNLHLFMENKSDGDDLFDRLNTAILNKHLNELMEGLTAKVFRTYNASWTLQQQLDDLTEMDSQLAEMILSYNRANRAVAILCNHQRSVPKTHEKSMGRLKEKIDAKRELIDDTEAQVNDARKAAKRGSVKEKTIYDKKKKQLDRLREQLQKLEIQETDRDENKTIALGTSKLNYLDPRISVAWCKKYNVPIEKIYNKTQRDKFRWAIDMAGPEFRF